MRCAGRGHGQRRRRDPRRGATRAPAILIFSRSGSTRPVHRSGRRSGLACARRTAISTSRAAWTTAPAERSSRGRTCAVPTRMCSRSTSTRPAPGSGRPTASASATIPATRPGRCSCATARGGIVVGWTGGAYPDFDLSAQRLNASGVAQWTSAGALVCGHSSIQREPASAPDDAGGFLHDVAGSPHAHGRSRVRDAPHADRSANTGMGDRRTTGTQLALAVLDVTSERVHLVWSGAESSAPATIERWSADADWRPIASVAADAAGRIVYDDRAIAAGERYGYRLIVRESGGADRVVGPCGQTCPSPIVSPSRVRGPTPRSATSTSRSRSRSHEPATLELDRRCAGRCVAAREVGSLGPGRHLVAPRRRRVARRLLGAAPPGRSHRARARRRHPPDLGRRRA